MSLAKVTGPLFSVSATGKIADAIVYFPWKGIHVVRQWLKPTNPESRDQGDRRVMLGGLGRAPKFIQAESVFHVHALGITVPPNTWISTFVKYIMTEYFTSVVGFDAMMTEKTNHGAASDFADAAVALGLTSFNLVYKAMGNSFTSSLMLYVLAKYGTDQYLLNNLKFNTAPYTNTLSTWDDTDIGLMVADFTPV